MANWEEWLQDTGKEVVSKWSSKEFAGETQQQMQLGALGQNGYYTEGVAGVRQTPESVMQMPAMSQGMKIALAGAGLLLLVVLLRD